MIHEDEQGRLWVHVAIRKTIAARPHAAQSGADNNAVARLDPDQSNSESVVELIDPTTSTVVASARFARWQAASIAGGFFVRVARSTANGQPLLEVWGFRLSDAAR
jgi:hypothetical protein